MTSIAQIIFFILLVSSSMSAQQTRSQVIDGLWRISYLDSVRGLVTGEAAIENGTVKGFFLDQNGEEDSFVCKKLRFTGSGLKGTFSPYQGGVKLDLKLFGKDRLSGTWEYRGNIKKPGPRDGRRTYDDPKAPYAYTARGNSTWQRMIPQIDRLKISVLENDALDFPKMKGRWDTAIIAADLPKIAVDLYGRNLPLHFNSKYFKLKNSEKKLSFQSMTGFPNEGRIRLYFYLLKDLKPGPKALSVNGTSFVLPLVFKDYESKGKYKISSWAIDEEHNKRRRQRLDDQIADLRKTIDLETAVLRVRQEGLQSSEAELLKLNFAAQELVKQVVSLIRRARDSSSSMTIDRNTQSVLTRRSYIKGRIVTIEESIISLAEEAEQLSKKGKRAESVRTLGEVETLRKELVLQKADLVKVENAIAPFLKSRRNSAKSIREQIATLRGKYSGLDRRRERALRNRLDAETKLDDQQLTINSLGAFLNEALAAKVDIEADQTLSIQSIRVADNDTDKTLFYSTRRENPKKALRSIDEIIDRSGEALSAARDSYLTWQATFEDYFEEARYQQGRLGGLSGKVMQSAVIQSSAEALFFVLDLAEDYKDGGLPLVIGDLIYKTGQAVAGENLTVDTLDEDQVRALRKAFIKGGGGSNPTTPMDQLIQFSKRRARSEALSTGVKGPIVKTVLAAAEAASKEKFAEIRTQYLKDIDDALLRAKSIQNKGKIMDFFENTAAPKFFKLLKGAAKSAGKDRLKKFAKELEKDAYIKYFQADLVAKQCYKVFHHARDEYWRALDQHNALLRTRIAIKEKQKNFDRESGFQLEKQIEFESGTNLRIAVIPVGGFTENPTERAYLNGILATQGEPQRHFIEASSLTPSGAGEVELLLRSIR